MSVHSVTFNALAGPRPRTVDLVVVPNAKCSHFCRSLRLRFIYVISIEIGPTHAKMIFSLTLNTFIDFLHLPLPR